MRSVVDVWAVGRVMPLGALLVVVGMVVFGFVPVRAQTTPDWKAVDAYVEAERVADRVPGIALAVVQNGAVVHMQSYGFDGTGGMVGPQSSFILGSMSKSFTALAVMQLVEASKLDLKAPVKQYLPDFQLADAMATEQITIAQLLNHTSGIPGTVPSVTGSIADHVRALRTVRPTTTPGSTFGYADANYEVLGAVVEQVSGQPFATYVQEHIFMPLGMTHSFTSVDAAARTGLALGHRYLFGFPQVATLPYDAGRLPSDALISSAEDMTHYMIAQLDSGTYNGASVLGAAAVTQMHQGTSQGNGFTYAMGWQVRKLGDLDTVYHAGKLSNYRGEMVLAPQAGWGVIVLTNISSMLPVSNTSHRIAQSISNLLEGTSLPEAGSSFKTTYVMITIVMALLLLNQVNQLVRPHRWQERLAEQGRAGLIWSVVGELIVPILLLLGLSLVLRLPWSDILRSTPDVGYWMLLMVALGLALGVWKALVAYRLLRSGLTDEPGRLGDDPTPI